MTTLRHTLTVHILLLLGALLTLGAVAVWAPGAVKQDFDVALRGNEALRALYEVGARIDAAKHTRDEAVSRDEARRGAMQMRNFMERAIAESSLTFSEQPLQAIADRAHAASTLADSKSRHEILDDVLGRIASVSSVIRGNIVREQLSAERKRAVVLGVAIGLCVMMILGALVVARQLYRSVTRPLESLSAAARALAGGDLSIRVETSKPMEFAQLAGDFNQMADHLQASHKDLETRVMTKSRELIRSERLAGVGYLAAGMAHEINNPLGIIAGHAELLLQDLRSGRVERTEIEKSLAIVTEESFRCKSIIQKLLNLSRVDDARTPINLSEVADEVVDMVGGLKRFEHVHLRRTPAAAAVREYDMIGNVGEVKQVILNLVVNAMEASPPGATVDVSVQIRDGLATLSVVDQGRGMSVATVEHLFEPFFTSSEGAAIDKRGIGLGLAITRAIVENHGGKIHAHSDGLGKGSRFDICFPMNEATSA